MLATVATTPFVGQHAGMELLAFLAVFALVLYLLLGRDTGNNRPPRSNGRTSGAAPAHRPSIRQMQTSPRSPTAAQRILRGKAWVIDGDTIVIQKIHIRIAGIDAPEMDQPYGIKSKYAMMAICKGTTITAELMPDTTYDRVVAKCLLPDGTDIAALLVAQGLALDWAKFSGGVYRSLEPDGVRKKLWRVEAKHRGQMWRIEADRARQAARR